MKFSCARVFVANCYFDLNRVRWDTQVIRDQPFQQCLSDTLVENHVRPDGLVLAKLLQWRIVQLKENRTFHLRTPSLRGMARRTAFDPAMEAD